MTNVSDIKIDDELPPNYYDKLYKIIGYKPQRKYYVWSFSGVCDGITIQLLITTVNGMLEYYTQTYYVTENDVLLEFNYNMVFSDLSDTEKDMMEFIHGITLTTYDDLYYNYIENGKDLLYSINNISEVINELNKNNFVFDNPIKCKSKFFGSKWAKQD